MPFQKGNKLGGRKKSEKLMTDALLLALKREAEDANGKPTRQLNLVVEALIKEAKQGNVQAMNAIFDRSDGKVAQAIIGEEDKPLRQIIEVTKFIAAEKPESENG